MTNFNDIKEMVNEDSKAVLIIDIRSAEDFEDGHIPESLYAGRGEVAGLMNRIPTEKSVFITG